jgi:hypothetical protein
MQHVQFSGAEPFTVDDDLAEALLDYAWQLAIYRRHDLVRLPARDRSGRTVTVTLLLGPAAVLSATTAWDGEPIVDDGTTADLRGRAVRLREPVHGDYALAGPPAIDDAAER